MTARTDTTTTAELLRELGRAARALDRQRGRRDELIRRASAEGASLRKLAAATGLNHETVRTIARENRSTT